MWRFLIKDFVVGSFLLTLAAISIPYFAPSLDEFREYSHFYGEPVLYTLIAFAFQHRLRSLKGQPEQMFWNYLTIPFALWAIVRVLTVTKLERWEDSFFTFSADIAYLLFYFFFFLASESRPDAEVNVKQSETVARIKIAGFVVTLLGVFSYFIIIPSSLQPDTFDALLPSYYMYIALDSILTVRFFQLYRGSTVRRWRMTFGLFSSGLFFLTVADLWEWLHYAELVSVPWGAWTDFAWDLPLLILVAAARLRHYEFPEMYEPSLREPFRFNSPLVVMAFSFPVFHFFLSRLHLLDPTSVLYQELLAYVCMGILGVLAAFEHMLLQRKARKLEMERSRVGKRADERAAFLNSLIASSPVAILVVDNQNRIQMCNAAFENLFLYPASEILGGNVDDLITTSATKNEAVEITRRVREGNSLQVEGTRRRKDGSLVDVAIHGIPSFMNNELIGIFVIYQDISEIRRAKAALEESEERFRQASAAMPLGMFLFSEDFRILEFNRSFRQIMGYEEQELQNKTIWELTYSEDRDKEGSLMAKLMASELGQYKLIKRQLRRDNEPVWTDVTVTAIRNQEGRFLYGLTMVEDITERRILEEQLARSLRLEAVGQLAGGIAHDFNNLLTVILGNSEILRGQFQEGDAEWSMTHEIARAAERAASLTQQLLAFSRKQPLSPKVMGLNAAIRGIEPMLQRLISENIELNISLQENLWAVEADPAKVEQVIMNLVLNARDAIRGTGKISISTSNLELDDHYALAHPQVIPGKYVRLSVTDSGIGMDPATLSMIFEPFFTTKETGKGTGLGLSTVYGIVKQSAGYVWAYSEIGKGTTLKIYLPYAGRSVSEMEKLSEKPVHLGNETILVVEDETSVRSLACRILQSHGYQVLEAGSPRKALDICSGTEMKVDLLLTDVVMPEMLGPDLAREITNSRPEMQVLFMSGYAGDAIPHPDMHVGATNFVEKPFSRDTLLRKVREVLDARPHDSFVKSITSETEVRRKGSQTVMLVEDNDAIRNALASMIQMKGYSVSHVSNSRQAVELLEKTVERISLLITDIHLPGLNGIQLAHLVSNKNPSVKTLFISGYSMEDTEKATLPRGSYFLQKPFRMAAMIDMIRELIGPAHSELHSPAD